MLRKTNPLLSLKRRHINGLRTKKEIGYGSRRGRKPRTTLLARTSNNLLELDFSSLN
jgi:hypothetical protein